VSYWLQGVLGKDSFIGDTGSDTAFGQGGADYVDGWLGKDWVFGGTRNDDVYGGAGSDDVVGNQGVNDLYGGGGANTFWFDTRDTGDIDINLADTIHNFTEKDIINLQGNYSPARTSTDEPREGKYSVWQDGSDYVVTYNSPQTNVWHDIIVQGADPTGNIVFF
jgi:Ca2+-binding RTX toxin-like protein